LVLRVAGKQLLELALMGEPAGAWEIARKEAGVIAVNLEKQHRK